MPFRSHYVTLDVVDLLLTWQRPVERWEAVNYTLQTQCRQLLYTMSICSGSTGYMSYTKIGNFSGSLHFKYSPAIIKNIQDIQLSTSFSERNQINRFKSRGQLFFPVFVSPTVRVCMCWRVYLHGGSLLGWDCCWWWGTLIFFLSPLCFLWDFDRIIAPWKQRNCFVTEENLSFQLEWMAACRW